MKALYYLQCNSTFYTVAKHAHNIMATRTCEQLGELSGTALDSQLKNCGFVPQQEGQDNFLLQGQLCVLTLILVSIPPLCYLRSM